MVQRLHTVEAGAGDRIAVLVHGMSGSTADWEEVVPALVDRGHRVVAVDLPGHGSSPADPAATLAGAAAALVASVPARPSLAMGHSLGAIVLAAAAADLAADRTVYLDASFRLAALDLDAATDWLTAMKAQRTAEALRRGRPTWTEREVEVRAAAGAVWDVATSAALLSDLGGRDVTPAPAGALVVRADPSEYVTDAEAAALTEAGFTVRTMPGAPHTLWYAGHRDELLAALDGWI